MHIQSNVSLLPYNTFRIQAKAKYFVQIDTIQDFLETMKAPQFYPDQVTFLGGGSNTLLTKDIDHLVIQCNIKGKKIIQETESHITIKVGAGEDRPAFVTRCCENNYAGIENLALIPGNVGTSPIQNIGAYGVEVKDTITHVECIYVETGDILTIPASECAFGYRTSIFKNDLKNMVFITAVTFQLQKIHYDENNTPIDYNPETNYGAIQNKLKEKNILPHTITPLLLAQTISEIRKSKLPNVQQLGTAGSFFKNPLISVQERNTIQKIDDSLVARDIDDNTKKLSAGQLIEKCGLKGFTLQGTDAATYEKHALVLINKGNASGEDVVALAEHIQQTVQKKYNVMLEPEVNYIS